MQGDRLGHYTIVTKLGEGGMGQVLLAEDTRLKRKVALKVLPPDFASDPARLERFQREAEVVAALNHPNIVTLHSIEEAGETRFLTMEWVEGQSLDRMIPPGGLPLAQVFDLGIAMADALAAAHEKGIVHRDFKPANVMLDARRHVKVLDFGLAKLAGEVASSRMAETATRDASLTGEGVVLGTVPYMSPEQVQGQELDARTDIFSLGVVLYELCTGQRPFGGSNSAELISSIMRDVPRPVVEHRGDVPRHLGRIIAHCIEKDPERRYQSVKDVRNELASLRREVDSGASTASGPGSGAGSAPGVGSGSLPAEPGTSPSSIPSGSVGATSEIRPSGGRGVLWGAVAGAVIVIALGAAFFFGTRSGTDRGASTGSETSAATGTGASAQATAETTSLVVLPFADRSPTGDQEYFTDGLSEELMGALGRIPDLRVAGRTSSFFFKGKNVPLQEIGQQLDVANVLEGSVRKAGDQIRVSVQLVKAADGFQLWSETYDRTLDDIFAVQDDIARSVATALQVTLLGNRDADTRPDAGAFDLVLQARFVLQQTTAENVSRARVLLDRALELESDYAPAWAEMGLVHTREAELASFTRGEDWVEAVNQARERQREALTRALEIDPDLAVAHSRMASVQWRVDWNFAAAERSNERALALDPNHPVVLGNAANLFKALGRIDDAIALYEKILRRDPLNAAIRFNLSGTFRDAGRLEEAVSAMRKVIELAPDPAAWFNLGMILLEQGRIAEASATLGRALEMIGKNPEYELYCDALVEHYSGNAAAADAKMQAYEEQYCEVLPATCAGFYALRDRADEAFEWLEKSYAIREPGLAQSMTHSELASLRSNSRWKPFWRKVGLPVD